MCESDECKSDETTVSKGGNPVVDGIAKIFRVLMYLVFGIALVGYLAPEVLIGLGFPIPWSANSWISIGSVALIVSSMIQNA